MIKRMDEEAKARFEEMYLTYQDTLRRLAYAYDIPVDDIDDIIQDTFVSYARYDYSLDQPEMGKKLLLGKILKTAVWIITDRKRDGSVKIWKEKNLLQKNTECRQASPGW